MSTKREFCEGIVTMIQANAAIKKAGNVETFVEDKADPAQKVQRALGKAGILAMVTITGHSRKNGVMASTAGDMTIEITCFENPKLNRTKAGAFTLTQAADAIVEALHGKTIADSKLRYLDMSRADADEHDYRMVVNFAAFTTINAVDQVKWGIGEAAFLGEVTKKTVRRAGVNVYEPDRRGNTMIVGTRDTHWEITLECSVAALLSEHNLPAIGTTFTYGGLTYFTDSAEMVSAGEDTSTVHLSGRTLN